MLSPSDIVVRSTNLTERQAAQTSAGAPAAPEPTPTTMAERFAPEAQKGLADDPVLVDPAIMPGFIVDRARARVSSTGQWLLVVAMLVSLIPTAVILALLWKGVIAIPAQSDAQKLPDRASLAASEQAALVSPPILQVAPEPEIVVAPKAEIALTAPSRIAAKSGDEVPFAIAIDSSEALPARSVIAIRAMPEGSTFSQGRPYGTGEWNLTPEEIGDLKLKLPETASGGGANISVALMAADGTILANATTRIDIAPDPNATLILRPDEAGRIADLIAHGHAMIDVGYFPGARAYFRRAAEAGSGDAALLLGATFDAEFIAKMGAQGIKPDPREAQGWYERARKLGVQDIDTKLKALKADVTRRQHGVQAIEATDVPAEPPAPAPVEQKPAAPAVPAAAPASQPTSAQTEEEDPPPGATETSLPPGSEEWVEITNYANLRAEPSGTAETLRVAEKGARLRVTGRKGNWVQVTDPTTSEVGWVYGRYIETAQAPQN